MDGIEVLDIGREAIWLTLKIGAPIMVIGLAVGLAIALFQALTQIQEMTLTYVPKIVAIFIALYTMMPFMAQELQDFMNMLADKIVQGGG
jgi:flagellar biosynthetic protein FliQ